MGRFVTAAPGVSAYTEEPETPAERAERERVEGARRRAREIADAALLAAAPDLAASVAHHEARAQRAEAERERLLPRKGEHVNELYACVARVLSRLGVQDHGGDPLEALESYADEEHERSLAETDARNTIAADRDTALAHAAELEAALSTERTARVRAEAEVDGRGRDLAAVARERDALRAAVREYVPRCRNFECDEIATHRRPTENGTAYACDRCAVPAADWWEVDHAATLRALVTEAPDAR